MAEQSWRPGWTAPDFGQWAEDFIREADQDRSRKDRNWARGALIAGGVAAGYHAYKRYGVLGKRAKP